MKLQKITLRKRISLFLLLLTGIFLIYIFSVTTMKEPAHRPMNESEFLIDWKNDSLAVCGDSWLKLNKYGMWELFVQGDPYTMGLKNGKLAQKLVHYQEEAFVEQIDQLIPSRSYMQFLRVFLGWFNRDLLDYVPLEYQLEVAGVSKSASDEFNDIAPPFQRIMSYHGAHDMGHALQSMCLVGCTSLGVWNNYSADSTLLIGRNFDFYAGDRFSENKIIAFMKPNDGYAFMSVTWGGMIGVVSGMNQKGLTITLNAEPSGIPFKSKTPVSILARKILQYASTIEEAYQIAKEYETFVSESFLIGSGKENRVALIEKTGDKIALYRHENYLVATNHPLDSIFHVKGIKNESAVEDASHYRFKRVQELIDSIGSFSVENMAELLRDRKGQKGKPIGMGNEKAINQLIAHHGIIFKPGERKVWVSAAPYQLGAFVAYDLDEIFTDPSACLSKNTYLESACIAPDLMLKSDEYQQFVQYRKTLIEIRKGMDSNRSFTQKELDELIALNENYYYPWLLAGNYYFQKKDYQLAKSYFSRALNLEIPQPSEYDNLVELISDCDSEMK